MTNPVYLIEADFGRNGRAFIETDRDSNSRAHVIGLIRSGEVKPVKIIEITEDEGTVRDVTADILAECIQAGLIEIGELSIADHLRDLRKHEAV